MPETEEQYGPEKVTEDLKETLFYPFNMEGKYNAEYVEFLRNLNEELIKNAPASAPSKPQNTAPMPGAAQPAPQPKP